MLDSHCHLNDEAFRGDVDETIERAFNAGVKRLVVIGYDLESSKQAIEIAHKRDGIYAAIGFHPENLEGVSLDDLKKIEELAKDEKVIAIGEIGLDYYWYKESEHRERQKEFFIAQIELANRLNLPISIHAREAFADTYEILKEHPVKRSGVLHCYSGSPEMLERFAKLGFYFGFDGPITYKNAKEPKENVVACPMDRILSETDSPYLSPVPYRGKRNEPAYIAEIVKFVAELKGIDAKTMEKAIENNFDRLFLEGR